MDALRRGHKDERLFHVVLIRRKRYNQAPVQDHGKGIQIQALGVQIQGHGVHRLFKRR
jgi:hypothetical protein